MRLVDADWLLKALGTFNDREHGNKHFFYGIESAKEIIENADTIDIDTISELVKEKLIICKNCRHREEDHHCWFLGLLTRDDDFCSFAERGDAEE